MDSAYVTYRLGWARSARIGEMHIKDEFRIPIFDTQFILLYTPTLVP